MRDKTSAVGMGQPFRADRDPRGNAVDDPASTAIAANVLRAGQMTRDLIARLIKLSCALERVPRKDGVAASETAEQPDLSTRTRRLTGDLGLAHEILSQIENSLGV